MKVRNILISILLIFAISFSFIACSNDPYSQDSAEATVVFKTTESRGISGDTIGVFDPSGYYWNYSAKKLSNPSYNKGATDSAVLQEGKGLDAKVGPFNAGEWEFVLKAYADAKRTVATFETKVMEVLSEGLNEIVLNIPVPIQSEDGKGKIYVPSNLMIEGTEPVGGLIQRFEYSNDGLSWKRGIISSDGTVELSSGKWFIRISYINDSGVIVATSASIINVYDNLTTVISGELELDEGQTIVSPDGNTVKAESETIVVEENKDTNLSVSIGSSSDSNKVNVLIPAGEQFAGNSAQLSVTAYSAAVASSKFEVSANEGVSIAALDISVQQGNGDLKSEFAEPITISSKIQTGLTGVAVKYNGPDDMQPFDVAYDSETGSITFKTKHLSEYYVVADVEAIDVTSGEVFSSLKQASSLDRDAEIKLFKNVKITTNGFYVSSNIIN